MKPRVWGNAPFFDRIKKKAVNNDNSISPTKHSWIVKEMENGEGNLPKTKMKWRVSVVEWLRLALEHWISVLTEQENLVVIGEIRK